MQSALVSAHGLKNEVYTCVEHLGCFKVFAII